MHLHDSSGNVRSERVLLLEAGDFNCLFAFLIRF